MNVMIAEDDFRVAGIHEQFLEKIADVRVVGKAQTAAETLERAEETQPDLILLDVYLPDKLGTDILGALRQRYPQVAVVLITAATEKAIFSEALKFGATDYLVKPIAFDRLEKAVEKARQVKAFFVKDEHINQTVADHFFQIQQESQAKAEELPKGIDPLTLDKVRALLSEEAEGITAEQMGQKFGASRTTSRRYLEYLISVNEAKAELEYGVVGRPERKYHGL
nr:response regulator [Shouchella shacheensis]